MNFIKWHLGDYIAATAHLSWDEDCAYRRLLDVFYKNEAPLPADIGQTCRLARATTPEQRQAVEQVLGEFFTLTTEGWRQTRADKEIEAANAQAGANRRIALEREAKRRQRDVHEPSTSRARSVVDSCTSQTPDTRHQTQTQTQTQTPDPAKKELSASPKTNTPPPPTADAAGGAFERFWKAWPSHPRKVAKDQCRTKWKAKGCDGLAEAVIASVESAKQSEAWVKEAGAFIPSPLVWLNQSRWEAPPGHPPAAQAADGAAQADVQRTQALLAAQAAVTSTPEARLEAVAKLRQIRSSMGVA